MSATTVGPVLALGLDPSGIVLGGARAREALERLGSESKQTQAGLINAAGAFDTLKTVAAGALAGFGIGFGIATLSRLPAAFISMTDEIKKLDSALRLTTNTAGEFRNAFAGAMEIANTIGLPVASVGDLYSKLAIAARDFGASQEEILTVVRAVSQSLAIQGVGAQQASAVLLQLGQAINSVNVQGDEFRSIMEGSPRTARAVAEGFQGVGTSLAGLRNEIQQANVAGKDFFYALIHAAPKLEEETKSVEGTFERAGANMRNAILAVVKVIDQATGASKTLIDLVNTASGTLAAYANRRSTDVSTQLKQLRADIKDYEENTPTLKGVLEGKQSFGDWFVRPLTPGSSKEDLRYQFNKNKLLPYLEEENRKLQERAKADDAEVARKAAEREAMIKPPKPRFEDEAEAARQDRDERLAREAKKAAGEAKSAASEAESARRKRESAMREILMQEAEVLEQQGRYTEAVKIREQVDIAAWREQAKESGLSAQETARGIAAITKLSEDSTTQRLRESDRLFMELKASTLESVGDYKAASELRLQLDRDEWEKRAKLAGLSAEKIAEGSGLISQAAIAAEKNRRKNALESLQEMEMAELQAVGKSKEASAMRKTADIEAWKEQATQAGLTAEQAARGAKLIEDRYARATAETSGFFTALGDAATSIAERIGDEFTTLFMNLINGGKLTAQEITSSFAKITITTLMQSMSRYAINSISDEMRAAGALKGLAGAFSGLFGGTTTGAEGQGIGNGVNYGGGVASAYGNVYQGGNVVPFAAGGVISQRTLFQTRGGYGMAGEAGPEGILPLARTSRGELGVKSTAPALNVKINNYSNARVSARSSEEGLTIDIDSIVADVIARRGSLANRAVRGAR
jgi:tape measure domain-containing protein